MVMHEAIQVDRFLITWKQTSDSQTANVHRENRVSRPYFWPFTLCYLFHPLYSTLSATYPTYTHGPFIAQMPLRVLSLLFSLECLYAPSFHRISLVRPSIYVLSLPVW